MCARPASKSSVETTRLFLFPRAAPAKRTIWHWFPGPEQQTLLKCLPPSGAFGTTRSTELAVPAAQECLQDRERPIRIHCCAAANPGCVMPNQFPGSAPRAAEIAPHLRLERPLGQKSLVRPLWRKIPPFACERLAPIARSNFFPNKVAHKFPSGSRVATLPSIRPTR